MGEICPIDSKGEGSMSTATHEQRLQALEAAVADLRSQQSAGQTDRSGGPLDGLPPDAEQPLVPGVPPKNAMRFRAKLASVGPAPRGLGLSQSQWATLNLEEADE
jgi:type II secretory pathway pseudopilin PulG